MSRSFSLFFLHESYESRNETKRKERKRWNRNKFKKIFRRGRNHPSFVSTYFLINNLSPEREREREIQKQSLTKSRLDLFLYQTNEIHIVGWPIYIGTYIHIHANTHRYIRTSIGTCTCRYMTDINYI